jgi:hypothetical protein
MWETRAGLDVPRTEAFSRYRRIETTLVRERDRLQTQCLFVFAERRRQTFEPLGRRKPDGAFTDGIGAQPKDTPSRCERIHKAPDDGVISTGVADNEEHAWTFVRQLLKIDDDIVRDEPVFRGKYPIGLGIVAVAVGLPQNAVLRIYTGTVPPLEGGLEKAVPVQGDDAEHQTSKDEPGECVVSLRRMDASVAIQL